MCRWNRSLRCSSAEAQARRLMWAQSHGLWAVCEDVFHPFAQVVVDAQVKEFGDQLVGDDGVKC